MNTQATLPPPPPIFDAAAWRCKLAGLTDPDYSGEDNAAAGEYKTSAIDLCVCLCEVFGDKASGGPLDRMTLWDRIDSALKTSASKVDDGNTDSFLSMCIEHVFGQHYHRNLRYLGLLPLADKPLAWRQGWIRYIARHVPAIIGHAALAWERVKAGHKDAMALKKGGLLSTGEIVERGVSE